MYNFISAIEDVGVKRRNEKNLVLIVAMESGRWDLCMMHCLTSLALPLVYSTGNSLVVTLVLPSPHQKLLKISLELDMFR